jgi:metal-responsive CopG/Arc/MetJ family transcriptional regulator
MPDQVEEVTKVTVTLPKDTVDKLDSMAKSSLLVSRGRVIQAMVDEVIEVQTTLKNLQGIAGDYQKATDKQTALVSAFLGMAVGLEDIRRRLSKFEVKA